MLIIFLKHVMMLITIQFLLTFAAPCSMFMYVFPKKATETALYVKLTRLLGQLVALELSGYASRVSKDSTNPRATRLKLKMKANSNVARGQLRFLRACRLLKVCLGKYSYFVHPAWRVIDVPCFTGLCFLTFLILSKFELQTLENLLK